MKILYYETCNSQYHEGQHLPEVQVMVDGTTTLRGVKTALKDNFAYGHLEYDVLTTEAHYDEYFEAVEELFQGCNLRDTWDSSLDIPDDDDDERDCYAYFILEGVTTDD